MACGLHTAVERVDVTTIDYVLIGVVLVSALVGLLRGIVRESLSLAVWVGAGWAAIRFGSIGAAPLQDLIAEPDLRLLAGSLLVFVSLVLAGSILTWSVGYLIRHSPVTGADRALGLCFGLGRGVLVTGLMALALQFGGFALEPWWQQSKLLPYAAVVGQALREVARDQTA